MLFFLIYLLLFSIAYSDDFPKIYGCFCEGGIITAQISQTDKLKIDGNKVVLYEGGRFIFAFGRKYKENTTIEVNGLSKTFKVLDKDYKIERIKGLPKNKVEPSKEELNRIVSDQKKIKDSKKISLTQKLFSEKFILPSKGRLSGVYGSQRILNSKPRKPHAGIDIAAKQGTSIVAPSSGKVKLVSKNMFFTGNTVILDHGIGLISIFAHLKDILVGEGDYISKGENIGTIGMTGRATGPHLHWGVYLKNTSVDPLTLIEYELY